MLRPQDPPQGNEPTRLIDWTGERCVPWAPDIPVIYEHYHRYLWARELVGGRRVLDLGSGEGFGSEILAQTAESVLGVDVAQDAVEHARLNHVAENLEFRVASATDLEDIPDGSVDVVVAFEVIEHIADQQAVLAEIDRVLAPGGLVVVSTPDRVAYADRGEAAPNPFHEKELTIDELKELLGSRFPTMRVFAQRIVEGSRIIALDDEPRTARAFRLQRDGDGWREGGWADPLYVIAVVSREALPDIAGDSTLSDFELSLMRSQERDAVLARAELDTTRAERDAARSGLEQLTEAHEELAAQHEQLQKTFADEVALVERENRERELAFAEQSRELQDVRRRLARYDASLTWKAFQKTRGRVFEALGGEDSAGARRVGATIRWTAGRVRRPAAPQTTGRIVLPTAAEPVASIVIPVHSGAGLTERCLQAIIASTTDVPYEVIIVDDTADTATKQLLSRVDGARILVNPENLGFLHSVNRGAAEARGEHVVLLNNDTEPQPGWLRAMLARLDASPRNGIVVAKLVYPDGTLQEAGGIVWRDGNAWNYGNGAYRDAPEYNFTRPVDYGSAAAMVVRGEVWTALGGFDERFAPGYWEDADLCFGARDQGWEVVYEPDAMVIHHEGGSMGTDEESGGKRHQALNRPRFAQKWHKALMQQVPHAAFDRAPLAADRRPGPVVLVIDHRVPRHDHDAGSLRMYHVIRNLVDLGCRVMFIPDNFHAEEPYASELRGMGVQVVAGSVDLNWYLSAFGPWMKLAIVSRPYVAPRYVHAIRQHAPQALIAYDTVDLHFLREQRKAEQQGDTLAISDSFRHIELGLANATDVTLVVSPDEGKVIHDLTGADTAVVPLANPVLEDVPGPQRREGVVFVGGFEHDPNVDAARHLARTIMPLVWRLRPDVTLTIVGGSAPPEVRELAGPNVVIAGWVSDLDPVMASARVSAAPIRYGAGVKGKVAQALACGVPVVTTTLGAEGLDGVDGEDFFVADDAEAFAQRIVELHEDDALWRRLSERGQGVVERTCSPAAQRVTLERLLADAERAA